MKTAFPGMSSNRGKHQPVFDDKTGRFCVKIDRGSLNAIYPFSSILMKQRSMRCRLTIFHNHYFVEGLFGRSVLALTGHKP